jgi:hypothetical protein
MRFRNRPLVAVGAAALLVLAGLAVWAQPKSSPEANRLDPTQGSVVFVCRNGVAMSLWSARVFNRLAAERGLSLRAASRASTPSFTEVPVRMRLALALDGFRVDGYRPRVISAEDVQGAERVILIDDAELPPGASAAGAPIETWAGFPPMREKYFESRAALKTRLERLVARLASSRSH